MAQGGAPSVDKNAKKGPQVSHVPDTAPYPVGNKPASQFEAVETRYPPKLRPGHESTFPGSAIAGRGGGHMGRSVYNLGGHLDVSAKAAGISGNAPKRSGGKSTPNGKAMIRKGME